jgi:chromosome segregation ATPase
MKRSFSLEIQQLQLRQSELTPQAYNDQSSKIRHQLQQSITDLQSQISRAEKRLRKLKTEGAREIPAIGLDTEWAHYYQAWDRLLQDRMADTASSSDILVFHRQVASKLEKQKQRLNKLRDYSTQLRESSAARNASKSTHRMRRIQELKAILTQFQHKLDLESQYNYEGRLEAAQREAQTLESELEECNVQRGQLESKKKALQLANRNAEIEIQEIEQEVLEMSAENQHSMTVAKQENANRRRRILELKTQLRDLQERKAELTIAIEFARQLQDEVSMSQNLISQFA